MVKKDLKLGKVTVSWTQVHGDTHEHPPEPGHVGVMLFPRPLFVEKGEPGERGGWRYITAFRPGIQHRVMQDSGHPDPMGMLVIQANFSGVVERARGRASSARRAVHHLLNA